jgi:hypothetical protein
MAADGSTPLASALLTSLAQPGSPSPPSAYTAALKPSPVRMSSKVGPHSYGGKAKRQNPSCFIRAKPSLLGEQVFDNIFDFQGSSFQSLGVALQAA